LLRDRDRIFGHDFVNQVKAMGIQQVLSAPRSPWQRAYIERLIGSIRRECLDHFIVFNERTLKRYLSAYARCLPMCLPPHCAAASLVRGGAHRAETFAALATLARELHS